MKTNKSVITCDLCGKTITNEAESEFFTVGYKNYEDTHSACRERFVDLAERIANPPKRAPKGSKSSIDPTA